MVKFDVNLLRYMTADDFRVLTAVEMGMRNHELVPQPTVAAISQLAHGGVGKALMDLTRHKLLCYERGRRYDGYRLNYLGYDYLALNVFRHREVLDRIGNQIGVGKESDVFMVADSEGRRLALKVHRLGRTCFRTVNSKRDYQKGGRKVHSWIYLSRLAATREFAFLKALHERGFPTPAPVAWNRHCIVMELIDGRLLNHLQPGDIDDPGAVYDQLMELLLRLANDFGVVHGDFNEFNIMLRNEDQKPILIDFPQMVPVDHRYARDYFTRDVHCIELFFRKRFEHEPVDRLPEWDQDIKVNPEREPLTATIDSEIEGVEDLLIQPENKEESDQEADEPELDKIVSKLDLNEQLDSIHAIEKSQVQPILSSEPNDATCDVDSDDLNEDLQTEFSAVSGATSRCTFAPQDVRIRIKREKCRQARHRQIQDASKNIKGESNAVRRKRNEDRLTIKDDIKSHKLDHF